MIYISYIRYIYTVYDKMESPAESMTITEFRWSWKVTEKSGNLACSQGRFIWQIVC